MSGGDETLASAENVMDQWEENRDKVIQDIWKKLETIEEKLDQRLTAGKQPDPDEHVQVFGDDHNPPEEVSFGHPCIAKIVGELKQKQEGIPLETDDIEEILVTDFNIERSGKQIRRIMKKLGSQHPDVDYRKGRGSRPSQIFWRGD